MSMERFDETPKPDARAGGGSRLAIIIAAGVAAAIAIFGIVSRVRARGTLARETNQTAAPAVTLMTPTSGSSGSEEIVLPGNVEAFLDAPIYARTSGYLQSWNFDIGARVRKGELLAKIESPEVDQQLLQARADLANAESSARLARITADRYAELRKTDSVSPQDADTAANDLAVKNAAVKSAQANVQRLAELVSFERIEAPFDGVITARRTDIGALIDSGASGGAAKELFHIASMGTVRVYINVPESDSRAATPGLPADLTLAEYPERKFPGHLVRTARAIDLASRTLLAEVDADNRTGELLPGASVLVHLKISSASPPLLLPVSTLIFRRDGLRVATVRPDGRAALLPVTLGRDFGTQVEVTSGLAAGQPVVDNPPDSLVDGEAVRVVSKSGVPAPPAGR